MRSEAVVPGLVSTVIPVFNRRELLGEAVASVLGQTYRPIEIIIVDDGSTDETWAACRALEAAHPGIVRAVRQENGGPGRAREAGRLLVRGEFIQYLDSDDILLPRKFEKQVAALGARAEADVAYCYTRYRRIGEEPEPGPWKRSGIPVERMFPSFLEERWWDTPTPLYRRSVCDEVGPWSELSVEEDWEYDCRIAATGARLVHCAEFLVEVRDHDGGRLCRSDRRDVTLMRHRAAAHRLIFGHARRAGLDETSPSMQRFARELFLLARQCGAAGLEGEAREMFSLALAASGPERARNADFRLYAGGARLLGWTLSGKLSCWFDQWRSDPVSTRGAGS